MARRITPIGRRLGARWVGDRPITPYGPPVACGPRPRGSPCRRAPGRPPDERVAEHLTVPRLAAGQGGSTREIQQAHERARGSGVAGALLLTACGPTAESGDTAAVDDGTFSMFIGEPENPLVPGNTTEDQGNQVVSSLWTGLVQYDEQGGVVYTGVADSITSDDSTTWTVKLKDGWTFHDGTPVTAASFVDAWNYTAYSPNAQSASYFFAQRRGLRRPAGRDRRRGQRGRPRRRRPR